MKRIIDLLNKIFAPRVTATYTYNGKRATKAQIKEMEEMFAEMDKILKKL